MLPGHRSDFDNDLSARMAILQMTDGIGSVPKRVTPIDDRAKRSLLEQAGERRQILGRGSFRHHNPTMPAVDELHRQYVQREAKRAYPAVRAGASHPDEPTLW